MMIHVKETMDVHGFFSTYSARYGLYHKICILYKIFACMCIYHKNPQESITFQGGSHTRLSFLP